MMKVLDCLLLIEDVDLGLKKPATLPISIVEFITVVIKVVIMEEVDIGLKRPANIPIETVY